MYFLASSSSYSSANVLFSYPLISSRSSVPELLSSSWIKELLALYSKIVLPDSSISNCTTLKSPMKAALVWTLFKPDVSDPIMIALGMATPIKQPMTIPIASPQIGVELTFDKSWMIKPTNVLTNVPKRSEYVFPYPAKTFASSEQGKHWNHSSRNDAPKNRPPLSIIPKTMLLDSPTASDKAKLDSLPLNHSLTVIPLFFQAVTYHDMTPKAINITRVIIIICTARDYLTLL